MTHSASVGVADIDHPALRSELPREPQQYENVEEMRLACEAEGWRLDYHQIEPGNLIARIAVRKVGGITLMRKTVNLRIEVLGSPPADHMTLIIPTTGNSVWTNGLRIDDTCAALLRPDAALHLVGGPASVIQMHVPFALLHQHGFSDPWCTTTTSHSGAVFVDMGTSKGRSLRSHMRESIYSSAGYDQEQQIQLATEACAVVTRALNRQQEMGRLGHQETWRTISRAREFIEENLDTTLDLHSICEHALCSISKLGRVFRRELKVTPGQYVLARRLSEVHRELRNADEFGGKVSDLAMNNGFKHLGRFAATYRRQFGQLPSETLRQTG